MDVATNTLCNCAARNERYSLSINIFIEIHVEVFFKFLALVNGIYQMKLNEVSEQQKVAEA